MLTKRTLTKWRKEALWKVDTAENGLPISHSNYIELCMRILLLTQELLDSHLLKGK